MEASLRSAWGLGPGHGLLAGTPAHAPRGVTTTIAKRQVFKTVSPLHILSVSLEARTIKLPHVVLEWMSVKMRTSSARYTKATELS